MFAKSIVTKGGDVFRDEFSVAFDGTNDYLDCGNTNDLGTGDFTITAWVKADDFDNVYIVSKRQDNDNRYYLRTDQSNPPRLQFYSKMSGSAQLEYLGSTGINLDNLQNQWVHFAISADRDGNIVGYINGILDDTDSADTTDLDNTGDFYIGRFSSSYSDCNISEIAIYNSALTANQVKTIYNGREPYNHKEGVASNYLQAWYRMGDSDLNQFDSNVGNILIADETNITLGSNIVTNGTFSADSDWTKGTGWSIGSGVASGSSIGMSNILSQDISAVTGKIYKVSFDITAHSAGNIILIDIGSSITASNVVIATATGHRTIYVKAAGSDLLIAGMSFGLEFSGSIDNVKVQQLGGNAGFMKSMSLADIEGDTP